MIPIGTHGIIPTAWVWVWVWVSDRQTHTHTHDPRGYAIPMQLPNDTVPFSFFMLTSLQITAAKMK
jgi:hypothetical protein